MEQDDQDWLLMHLLSHQQLIPEVVDNDRFRFWIKTLADRGASAREGMELLLLELEGDAVRADEGRATGRKAAMKGKTTKNVPTQYEVCVRCGTVSSANSAPCC